MPAEIIVVFLFVETVSKILEKHVIEETKMESKVQDALLTVLMRRVVVMVLGKTLSNVTQDLRENLRLPAAAVALVWGADLSLIQLPRFVVNA